jgi:hypothetical protein
VDVAAPAFRLSTSRVVPWSWQDNYLFTGNLNWQLPRGSRLTFGYTRNRFQNFRRTTNPYSLYRSDNMDGTVDQRNVFTLGSFLTLSQTATQQIALDLRVSYQADGLKEGIVDPTWYIDHLDPAFGFTFSNVKFHGDENTVRQGLNLFDPTELELRAARSGGIFADSTALYPGRTDLEAVQTLPGLGQNLRANPYGWSKYFYIRGPANAGLQIRKEDRLQLRAALD